MNENKPQPYQAAEEPFTEQSETPGEAGIGLAEAKLKNNGLSRSLFVQLSESGEGFYSYAQYRYKQFGTAATIQALQSIAAA